MTEGAPAHVAPLASLHRYFIWANRMRTHFDEVLEHPVEGAAHIEAFLYMSYWYGGLFVVIEGWQELKLTDPVIDALLQSSNVTLLKRYRNGAFHFQKDYNDPRFTNFIEREKGTVEWVRKLNLEFGRYFLTAMGTLNAARQTQ